MAEADPTATLRTPAEIQSWVLERVAHYLREPVGTISADASLADCGLDSVYAFALCGDIEDTLGLPVEPTLIWDVDTIGELVAHLAGLAAEQAH
ncbi:acyl carrier protein [Streptomyces sp. RLB1-33]|uniref:acyl carrier protein n=1 Tax=Streptomyces mirabilis TaxID=68239 RepID=UPI00143EA562|nr:MULTISPECIES: acyl carrier protein [Streptomyces]QIY68650.1 acyl carrier protein [Streptomyces sp. RLB1-33]QUW84585.1 acyl carrier protein [Streptomyces mirabilis]